MKKFLYGLLGIIDNLTAIKQSVADREHTLIRPFNQAVLMYPTALLGLVGFFLLRSVGIDEGAFGRVYVWTLFVNLLVLFFDLRPAKTVIILFSVVIAGFVLHTFGKLADVTHFFGRLDPRMNPSFYLLVSIIWAVIFFFVWLDRRSFVIVVEANHVVIHDKWIGEAQAWPTEAVTFTKEIGDAMELALGFGTIKICNANNGQLLRAVPHVFRVSYVLDEIKRVTAELHVEADVVDRPKA
ncbi:MAG: hypothetical protein IPH13_05715 [Planctomycetes bacterium]|nr:hypothetical protein [Planctomycetota bacterium]MCC7171274.1 hypothetical protein [Planctomycetota bacterium]